MRKLPYEYVVRELDKLYEKQFLESDIDGVNAHCEFIHSFIESCGWSCQEMIEAINGLSHSNSN